MFVITVIPLRRGVTIDTLSYFSAESYPVGTMLTIPIRNSTSLGLVTNVAEVSAAKTALRAATFSLKKLPVQKDTTMLAPASVATARKLCEQYVSSVGAILYNLLPTEVRNGDIPLPHTHHVTSADIHTPLVLEAKKSDRYLAYRSLVRETFAHSGSVLIVVPTSVEASEVYGVLSQGIRERTIVLSTASTKSELKKAFTALEDFSQTKLIIATPSYAFIERHDITYTIIESARSHYFKELTRPYLDHRKMPPYG